MKSQIFFGALIFFVLFLLCFLPSFAYYNFLSPEANIALEELKEKHRIKGIVLEKEEGIVYIVVLPKNDGVETKEIREWVYNDETKQFEGPYNFTYITITNSKGWASVIWGSASKFHLYDIPKLCFVYENNGNRTVLPPLGTPSDIENWYWLPYGNLEGSGSWIQW